MEEPSHENGNEAQTLREEIYETIIRLNQERLSLEHETRFTEAGRVKSKLKLLGDEFVKVSLNELRERQFQEKQEFEARYEKELEDIQATYDGGIQEKERYIQEKLGELQEAHNANLRELQAQLKAAPGLEVRTTPDIINTEYQIKRLVTDQRYDEAGVVQKKLDALKAKMRERNSSKADGRVRNRLERAMRDQLIELSALEAKLLSERDGMVKTREKAIEAIHSKYHVFYEKMLKAHQVDAANEERALRNFNPSSNYIIAGK